MFPSGRGFGYIVYPDRDDGLPTYNEGYLFDGDGELIPAWVVDAPWLRRLQPRGEDVSVVLETAKGTTRIQAETVVSTISVMGGVGPNPALPGAAAGDRPLHLGRRDRQRDDGALDAGRPDRPVMTATGGARVSPRASTSVVEKAKAQTGLDDFGGDSWREGLEVLVGAAETESTFNDYGEQSFYASLVRPLVNRLHIEDWYARHPEIDEQDVHVELLGVGSPDRLDRAVAPPGRGPRRSGTSGCGRSSHRARRRACRRRTTRRASPPRPTHGRHGEGAHGRADALDAAAVGDRADGGPRPHGARVQGADLPRRRAHARPTPIGSSTATWSRRTGTRSGC